MTRILVNKLNSSLPDVLARVKRGEVIIVEDENGQFQCSITPYIEASPEDQKRSLRKIGAIQDKVEAGLREKGITEEDVDRLLQEDD